MLKTKFYVTFFQRTGEFYGEVPEIDWVRLVSPTFDELRAHVRRAGIWPVGQRRHWPV